MTRFRFTLAPVLIAFAATRSSAQQIPPIRQLGPVTHVAAEKLGAVTTVRPLSNGNVLVNDIVGRRVVLLDSALNLVKVVADTTSATAGAYGARPGGLIAFHGDSTLFVDLASLSMLLIDPNGSIGRVMAVPRASDAAFLIGGPFGTPGFDPAGRLIYRAPPRLVFPPPPGPGQLPQIPPPPDSAALVRVDLATRKVDTVTWFKIQKINLTVSQSPDGGIRVINTINPLPQTDDWAVLPDGTVALVRARDYHVDWIAPDGTRTSGPKVPFQWEKLSDEAKVAYVDSARTALEKARASGQFAAFGLGGGRADGPPAGTRAGGAGAAAGGGAGTATGAAAGAGAGAATTTVTANGNTTVTAIGPGGGGAAFAGPMPNFVSPSELPDYKPAFTAGSTRADADGNLWIRTTQNVDARPVYNVVNRKGELIDRVQLPQNRVLAGFGPRGVVYLGVRDGTMAHIEVARVR
jgi:hypothetical protein